MKSPYTEHYKIEVHGVEPSIFVQIDKFRILAKKYAKNLGVSVVEECLYKFPKQGITYIQILKESHLAYHTWPEHEFMLIDLLTCTELNKTLAEIKQVTQNVFVAGEVLAKRLE